MTTDAQIKTRDTLSPKNLRPSFEYSSAFYGQQASKASWQHRDRSPITDTLFWIEQAGWKFKGPAKLIIASNIELNLTENSPGMIQKLFVADLQTHLLDKAVKRMHQSPEDPDEDPHPRAQAIRERDLWGCPFSKVWNSAKWSFEAKKILKHLVCGTVPTSHVLWKRGYQMEPTCQYCGLCDTVFHRLWHCPHGDAARAQVDAVMIQVTRNSVRKDPLYTSLGIPTPEIVQPPPEEDIVEYIDRPGGIDPFGFCGMVECGSVFVALALSGARPVAGSAAFFVPPSFGELVRGAATSGRPHRLWAAQIEKSDVPVLCCTRCGPYCTKTPRHFLGPCKHVKTAQLRDFRRGLVP